MSDKQVKSERLDVKAAAKHYGKDAEYEIFIDGIWKSSKRSITGHILFLMERQEIRNLRLANAQEEAEREKSDLMRMVSLLHEEATTIEDRNIDNFKPDNLHKFHTQIDIARCLRTAANYLDGNAAG